MRFAADLVCRCDHHQRAVDGRLEEIQVGSKEAELHRDCLLWILEIDIVEEICTTCLHCNIHFGCTLFPLSIDCLLENEIRSPF